MAEVKIFNMGGFDNWAADSFIRYMLAVENSNQPYAIVNQTSGGGYVYALNKILDCMAASNKPVVCINSGISASCAAVLFAASDYRVMGESSTLLIHEPSGGTYGKTTDMEADVNNIKDTRAWMFDLLDKKCKQPSGFFAKLSFDCNNSDIYLNFLICVSSLVVRLDLVNLLIMNFNIWDLLLIMDLKP